MTAPPHDALATLPDPGPARSLDDLAERLRALKGWAGDPSYEVIKERVNAAWRAAGRPESELTRRGTVVDCFKTGRRRINTDLFIAVVRALWPDRGYVSQWRHALRVVSGETRASAQVRTQDTLPAGLPEFTGREAEVARLRRDTAGVATIVGMAGVGKTELAVHVAHLLDEDDPFDQILFVDLRGFHFDPAQPPADPSAVLDGFLHLLGVPGQQIPHDLAARAAEFGRRLTGRRTLVVLDNAADDDQIRPLLPPVPGCRTLVTSRRSLHGVAAATRLTIDVFTAAEAHAYLARRTPGDAGALARIAECCGHLPLALGLVCGHIRARPGWTLHDHAERLAERHREQRLESGVELALSLSYQHLPPHRQRLLRLLAAHPGQDLDAYAAAALAGTEPGPAARQLRRLADDHLLQQHRPGRFGLHDLVRAFAAERSADDDRPADRRAALNRLFDYYVATSAAAMDTLHPAEALRRPEVPAAGLAQPDLSAVDAARAWLDTERPVLAAVATLGRPEHAVHLSAVLFRYLDGGHYSDALAIHARAQAAAVALGDRAAQAQAVLGYGTTHSRLGRYDEATVHLRRALALFEDAGDLLGQARALANLGNVAARQADYPAAAEHYAGAMTTFRAAGDLAGEARALGNLGTVEERIGRYPSAAAHLSEALDLSRRHSDQTGEAQALDNLGTVRRRLGRPDLAAEHHEQALTLFRRLGNRSGEAWALDNLGASHTSLGRTDRAVSFHTSALALFRAAGDRDGETWAHNGLGEAALLAGDTATAVEHHTAALTIATEVGARDQQARAYAGLGRALGPAARDHVERALALYTDLGAPEAEAIQARLSSS